MKILHSALESGNALADIQIGYRLWDEDPESGIEALRAAANLGSGEDAYLLGQLLENEFDLDGSREAHEQGLKLGDVRCILSAGYALQLSGDIADAVDAYNAGIALGDSQSAQHLSLLPET